MGEHYASHATDSVCLLLVNLGAFVLWEVPPQRDFLLCWKLRWAAPLEVHTGISLGCCYQVFVVILERGAVLHMLLGPALICVVALRGVVEDTLEVAE